MPTPTKRSLTIISDLRGISYSYICFLITVDKNRELIKFLPVGTNLCVSSITGKSLLTTWRYDNYQFLM